MSECQCNCMCSLSVSLSIDLSLSLILSLSSLVEPQCHLHTNNPLFIHSPEDLLCSPQLKKTGEAKIDSGAVIVFCCRLCFVFALSSLPLMLLLLILYRVHACVPGRLSL